MGSIKIFRSATTGIVAVLLFGIVFTANADVMIKKALPAPTVAQPLVVAPAVPSATQPITPNSTIAPKTVLPTMTGGGGLLKPGAACLNNTPRINDINGKLNGQLSASMIRPGDYLQINGCNLGAGVGKVTLLNAQQQEKSTLTIVRWGDTNILARIDPNLGGVPNFIATLKVSPNGASAITSKGGTFIAALEDYFLALPMRSNKAFTVKYSQAFGVVRNISNPSTATIADHVATIIERVYSTNGICPNMQDPYTQMVDTWHIDSKTDAFDGGYTAVGIKFTNDTKPIDNGATVGSAGATFSNDTVTVHFQGAKDNIGRCSSIYDIALIVRGPRGIWPKRINENN